MNEEQEGVYTVHDYYDGPKSGFAAFRGAPHAYVWDYFSEADSDDVFLLAPITEQMLQLVLEDEAIWRRWEVAFKKGETTKDTHPALPADRVRHEQLKPQVDALLKIDQATSLKARGRFIPSDVHDDLLDEYTVIWTPLEEG